MRRIVCFLVLLLVCMVNFLQAQTTVVEDTFTVTPERPAGLILPGQTTEVGGRIWHGDTDPVANDVYSLTANGDVECGNGTVNDWMATVPYFINPADEIVTLQVDIFYPSDAVGSKWFGGIGFIKATATPGVDAIAPWQHASMGMRLRKNGLYEFYGDKFEDPGTFNWFSGTLTTGEVPNDTWVTIKMEFNSATNTFNAWITVSGFTEEQVAADADILLYEPDFVPSEIGWVGMCIRDDSNGYGGLCDNFLVTSTNPLPSGPSLAQVKGMGVNDVDPELLEWIAVDDQVYMVGTDIVPALAGASYDIDTDFALFQSTDPNGPRWCIVSIDSADSPPITQLDAEKLTADGKLSTGTNLDWEVAGVHLGSAGRFLFDAPLANHTGADVVVIQLDRSGDYSCSSQKNLITLLDDSYNPIPGQSVSASCGAEQWFTAPGDGGVTQNYDVTGVNPSFGTTIRVDSTIDRTGYVAYAIDIPSHITSIGGVAITSNTSQYTPVEVFAIPETGSYTWHDDSCEAGIYAMTDFNEDCITDLADFAQIAAQWLDCNSVFNVDCWN
ncbi:MAG: hypothetical protein JW709_12605 [Sedimentisphaerales bacterium]|nr:hypothetical protein [Sedimentisphaerales bacterium]